ncbi:MAG: hypothetical protein J7L88_06230, partial [Thermoplasmata archaeon]|nr:hypothetical protein [Thermoplasmata archaeon]
MFHPRKRAFLLAALVIVLFLGITHPGGGLEGFEEKSYSVHSMISWNLTSPKNTTNLFHTSLRGEGVSLARYTTPARTVHSSVSYYTHYFTGGHRTVGITGSSIFQVTRDSSGKRIYLVYSTDNGTTFHPPILVAYSSSDYLTNPGILIENGRVHVFFLQYYAYQYWEKWANLTEISNITTRTPQKVNVYYSSDKPYGYYDVAADTSYVYLVHTTQSHRLQLWRRKLTDESWERNPINLTGSRSALYCAMASCRVGTNDYLVVAYTRYFQWGISDGYVHSLTLRYHGTQILYSRRPITAVRNFRQLSLVSDGGYRFYLSASLSSQDDIYFTKSTNIGNGWSAPQVLIANRGAPQQGYFSYDQSIGRDREGRLVVVYEHSSSNVYMVYSEDDGATWTPEYAQVLVAQGPAFDPSIAAGGYVVDFLTGSSPYTHKEVSIFVPAVKGTFNTTTRKAIPLLHYDALFVNASYYDVGNVSVRILDERGGVLLNWTHLNFTTGGWCGPLHYTASISLSEYEWATDRNNMEIRLEFKIECDQWALSPEIIWAALNFTASFPYWDNLTNLKGISSYEGLDYQPGLFRVKMGTYFAKLETETIQRETGPFPDYLMLNVGNLSASNYLRVEVREGRRPYNPIPGFSRSDCTIISSGEGWVRVHWGFRHFGDLPSSYSKVRLVVYITSDQSLLPELKGIAIVRNSVPRIRLATINTTTVFRGSNFLLSVHVTDREDVSENLDIEVETRREGENGWVKLSPNHVEYNPPFWELVFTPQYNMTPGTYNLRVRVSDTRGAHSDWYYLEDQIAVLNNPPTQPVVAVREEPVTILNDVHIYIKTPSEDVETPSNEITYRFTLYRNGHFFAERTIMSGEEMVIKKEELNKGQKWRIKVEGYDGENYSIPAEINFTVINLPPAVKVPYYSVEMEEDSSTSVDLTDLFSDPDDEKLSYTYTGNSNILVSIEGDILLLTPKENFFGEESFTVIASDGESSTEISVIVEVLSVNDLPVLETPGTIVGREGEWIEASFNASDDADQERVTISTNITQAVRGLVSNVNFHITERGFRLLPDNSMVGEYVINVTATDESGGSVYRHVRLVILNVNNPPTTVTIKKPKDGDTFLQGEEIEFIGEARDPDTIHGQELTYVWRSNVSGVIGEGSHLVNVTLPLGSHRVTLSVTDGEYVLNKSIVITVLRQEGG